MKRLITLLRHGETVTYDARGDFCRPLTEEGKLNVQRIGAFLHKKGLHPDRIIASPAERTLHSAQKLHKTLYPGIKPDITTNADFYNAPAATLFAAIAALDDDAKHVLIVGHNPGISELPALLAGADMRKKRLFPTLKPASMVMIEITGDWADISPAAGRILHLVDAASVAQDFPWPDLDGKEKRKRPAYFYHQSSVIPFRFGKDGDIEILMTLSSGGKHYVIPKGAIDPGLTAVESAAKEAREEAGCLGKTLEPPVGKYHYLKWGARCSVEVFAMQVEQLLPDHEWEESHRGRKWVSLAQAIETVKEEGLRKVLRGFKIQPETLDTKS
ncbi:histidine phosphatase family protein [Thalassospira mesophila]|uniref:histidine phosphatase family protein n=1 Tax=Thalassospira mesophila TaxID=1293891 RepID=UPI000A1E12F7|nr:histidine phosphatase family protein [Thalassospira mesophila]